jgi:hypothetical protein
MPTKGMINTLNTSNSPNQSNPTFSPSNQLKFMVRFDLICEEHWDQAFLGKHIKWLYDQLSKHEASTLAQLRTGKCRLNGYLACINVRESDQCDCGRGPETVNHFLFKCSRWETMKQSFPDRFGDLAFSLGGWSGKF